MHPLATDAVPCDYCRRRPATDREHMVPTSLGGTDDPSNIARACKRCNSRKGPRIGVWLPCGRASWLLTHCIDMTCLKCAPLQLRHESLRTRLRLLTLLRRRHDRLWRTEIIKAIEEGGSLREVAELVGLSNPGVMKIRDREGRKPGS